MKKRLYRYMAIGWLLLAASLSAQAAPYFTNKEGNLIWDKGTGLVWMRCSLGQTWDGMTCTGKASNYTFDNASFAAKALTKLGGFSGWQVPSVLQLQSLVECTSGFNNRPSDQNIGRLCNPESVRPTVDSMVFAALKQGASSFYWSSTAAPGTDFRGWIVNLYDSDVDSLKRGYEYPVRVIHDGRLSDSEGALAFPINLQQQRHAIESKALLEKEVAERKAHAERDAAERDRRAAENNARADRVQALKQLLSLGARGLYLEAGKAQRNGAVTFVNTRFSASELYEMIVDKFPDSDYAVKATDQLTAMSRSSRDQSAAQSAVEQSNSNARERAYEACRIEMNSCYSRTNGKGSCYRDCERLR